MIEFYLISYESSSDSTLGGFVREAWGNLYFNKWHTFLYSFLRLLTVYLLFFLHPSISYSILILIVGLVLI